MIPPPLGRRLAINVLGLLVVFSLNATAIPVSVARPAHYPDDSTGRTRVHIYPTPGPGNRVQLHLNNPPAGPLLVTIQDRLGHTRYQQWHGAGRSIVIHFEDVSRSLPPGLYSAVVSTQELFVKTKFVVE